MIGADEALLGGVTPQFVVDVSAAESTVRSGDTRSSMDELTAAVRAAAVYTPSTAAWIIVTIVAAFIALAIDGWLLVPALAAGIAAVSWSSARAARRRRVAVLYRVDDAARQSLESVHNGVAWLASSRALWCITHEERVQRPANTTSVIRVEATVGRTTPPFLLTNIPVPSIVAGGETLFFLPNALVVRDRPGNFVDFPYASVRVDDELTKFTESGFVPSDSRRTGGSWLYANKDGSPDRRRAHNPYIPVVDYARVTLSWPRSGCVLLVSSVSAARHFADAVQQIAGPRQTVPQPKEVPMPIHPRREPTAPSDLERALQDSIDRKRRQEQLDREAALAEMRAEAAQRAGAERPRPSAVWLPQGRTAMVQGFATGDFVYVGNALDAVGGRGVEPALIDPDLPVHPSAANTTGEGMTYWPSYSSISASSRRAFLQWLAGGRRDSNAYIGYVFVFFYGLERRVYEFMQGGGSSADEVFEIGREVSRLLGLYAGTSRSFASYGTALLDLIATIEPRARNLRSDAEPVYGVSQQLKMTLGELAQAGKPIPADHALRWVRSTYSLNTPASRCPRELELLFHVRYAQQFGDGIFLQPTTRTIDLTYRPASSALPAASIKGVPIPDVTLQTRPLEKILALAQECTDALDPFSRFLGRNENGRESLAAFALLPDDLIEATPSSDAASLASLVRSRLDEDGRAHLAAGELLQFARLAKPDKATKNESVQLAQALEKLGYGIEPDARLGGPVYDVDGRVVVFRRLPDCPSAASDEYAAATLLVRLGAMVSAADDAVSRAERELLEQHIEQRLQLNAGERQRLAAYLAWILEADLGTAGLKRRLESLPADSRHAIAKVLIEIAATDDHVDAREMKILEKLYGLLDLPAADLYRDIHAVRARDDEPVALERVAGTSKGFTVPKPAAESPAGIDMDRVRLKIAETRQVSTLLSGIFAEEETPAAVAPVIVDAGTIGTLDPAHSELLRRLASRERWPRDEVERLAAELALLPDGALETINDYAYAAASEPFWEDEDPVAINSRVAMELTA